MILVFILFIFL